MSNSNSLNLQKDDFLILAMALKSLHALRLNPCLSLAYSDAPREVIECMDDSLNGFTSMCCDLDLVVTDPAEVIARLQRCIDMAAGSDVYQAYATELKTRSACSDPK